MKIAHIADTHIKNLKYHQEYKEIFEQIYDSLRENKVDYIVHCGDIAHTKTQISPEFVDMCSDFFRNLSLIAPTYIILGNHDGNLKNSNRQDAITPIVEALNLPHLHLLKNSGEVHLNNDLCLNVLSVFDRDNWTQPTDSSKINIALYHGSISGCKTDADWEMVNGEDDISIFNDFDFAMLGDIHRCQALDKTKRVWYAGSTVQQNHGESNDKGLLLWNIKSKNDWNVDHIVFNNPKPFFTITLTPTGKIPRKTSVPSGARLRLVSENNLPLDVMRKALDVAKHKYKPESVTFLNRAAGSRGSVEEIAGDLYCENLRDINVQEELISEYLKDYQIDEDTLESIYELNRKYNKIVEDNEEVSRNVNWKINNFKWDNLFNYGEDNNINFDSLSGIIGIFGKNFSGKSSVIDAALYTLFNTTSKNERKNLNVINQNRDYGRGELEIEIGDKVYYITRQSVKYTRRVKKEEITEAKTELNFEEHDKTTGETTSLNGTTRAQTDANIRKHFGTIEDFSMSSLASQHGAFSFVDEGSTKRKEIIAKFLDLEFFDQKFKLAKEDSRDTKVLLNKCSDRDFDVEISETEERLAKAKQDSEVNQSKCEELKIKISVLNEKLNNLKNQIASAPTDFIDVAQLVNKQNETKYLLSCVNEKITEASSAIGLKEEKLAKANALVSMIDISSIHVEKEEANKLKDKINSLMSDLQDIDKKKKLLNSIPCGNSFPTCRFIKDAHVAVASSGSVESELQQTNLRFANYDLGTINKRIEQYENIVNLTRSLQAEISTAKLERERNKTSVARFESELIEIEKRISYYEENKEVIENLQRLIQDKSKIEKDLSNERNKLSRCERDTLQLYKQVGSCEEALKNTIKDKESYLRLQREFTAYDLFMRCMHTNGISYDIIKNKIPVINEEIAKILANIVDFEIFFDSSGNKFDIFIKHPAYDERPIEMASGAEKTMAAIAIRLSLLSVSSLPKADLFILDEPGTALDAENMDGFIRILELIKVYFKNVLLISHLDSLKDCVDMQIVIDKEADFAKIKQ